MDVTVWQDRARLAGFDRMVIHDRDEGDAAEVGNFLSVYRRGQAWSRWGFARVGSHLRAWCCLTGADVGDFTCLSDALACVLFGGQSVGRTVANAGLVNLTELSGSNIIQFGSAA